MDRNNICRCSSQHSLRILTDFLDLSRKLVNCYHRWFPRNNAFALLKQQGSRSSHIDCNVFLKNLHSFVSVPLLSSMNIFYHLSQVFYSSVLSCSRCCTIYCFSPGQSKYFCCLFHRSACCKYVIDQQDLFTLYLFFAAEPIDTLYISFSFFTV